MSGSLGSAIVSIERIAQVIGRNVALSVRVRDQQCTLPSDQGKRERFRAALKAYKRTYLYVMVPVLLAIFGIDIWIKAGMPLSQ